MSAQIAQIAENRWELVHLYTLWIVRLKQAEDLSFESKDNIYNFHFLSCFCTFVFWTVYTVSQVDGFTMGN